MNTFNKEKFLRFQRSRTEVLVKYFVPIFLIFSILDYVFYHSFFNNFLYARILGTGFIVLLSLLKLSDDHLVKEQFLSTLAYQSFVVPVIYMLFLINSSATPYYMGIIIFILGMEGVFKFSWRFFFLNISLMTLPILYLTISIARGSLHSNSHLLPLLFIVFAALISTVLKHFNDKLHFNGYRTRSKLHNEITNRNEIIDTKINELIEVNNLAKQFSPQVLKQIENIQKGESSGELSSRNICVLFVDIVGSTEKINELSNADFNQCISKFMELTTRILLKNELTIDKFLGDGFLAFSNAPFKLENYIEKVLTAALEILDELEVNKDFFNKHWQDEFKIRIGIDSGEAKVGFIGTHNLFKTYSAIGVSVNKASRLCSVAQEGHILLSEPVLLAGKNTLDARKNIQYLKKKKFKLKGFHEEEEVFYSLRP